MSDELDEAIFTECSIESCRRVRAAQVYRVDRSHRPSLPGAHIKVAGNAGDW